MLGISSVEAITYSQNNSYWQTWINNLTSSTNARYRSSRARSVNWGASYYGSKNRSVTSVPVSAVPYRKNTRTYPVYRNATPITSIPTIPSSKILSVSVLSTQQNQPIYSIDQTPIKIFKLGINNKTVAKSTDFVEALKLDTLTFQMFSNTGIATDPRMFELGVRGSSDTDPTYFQFESDGTVTLKFHNARVAKGEGMEFDINVRVESPANTPRVPGAFRLRLLSATASTEQTGTAVSAQIIKNALSDTITFTPGVQVSEGETPVVESRPVSSEIFGRIVSAGEKVFALALNFEAHYDDMLIQEITVRNTTGGADIDKFVSSIYAIDTVSGQTLGQSKFTQGKATFRFFSPIRVNREQERHIGFRVLIGNRVDTGRYDTRFKLDVASSDVIVQGVGSGRELSDSYKNFSANTHTFLAVQSGGGFEIAPSATQPDGFSATESMERVYQFKIINPDDKEISIGRLSFDIRLSGVEFSGGMSADDFQLKQIQRGREVEGAAFTPTVSSSNVVVFDAGTEFYIPRHGEVELVLKTKLADISGGNSDMDSVSVQVLGDSTLSTGSLSTVRSNNASLIWSDHSGRPHTLDSTDWISGYLITGVPTETTRNYRSGR